MPRTFSGGQGTSILHQMWGNRPLFRQPFTLYVHRPGLNATGRRLLQTDLVRAQGGPQDPGRCARCPEPSVGGTERRPAPESGRLALISAGLGPLIAALRGEASWCKKSKLSTFFVVSEFRKSQISLGQTKSKLVFLLNAPSQVPIGASIDRMFFCK